LQQKACEIVEIYAPEALKEYLPCPVDVPKQYKQ
jgi:hypothetical protein